MKYSIFAFFLCVAFFSCNQKPEGFIVEGSLRGDLEEGTMVYLKQMNEQNKPVDRDTAIVKNGSFTFSGVSDVPELHYIFIDKLRGNIPVILENGTITVEAQKDSLSFSEIEGTLQNDLFTKFLTSSRALSRKAMSLNEDMRATRTIADTAVRTSTLQSLRDEYLELQEEAKNLEVNFAKENPDALISALIIDKALTTKALPEGEIKALFEALTPEIKGTRVGKKIGEELKRVESTSIGAKAPNFTAPTPSGQELALHDVLGKATILDFWAAWCKPCRIENPNVVRVYHKYHDKGLNILGVSLDRKAEDWKKAIEDDGLVWNHVSNVQYFDEIAKLYNVNAIPATFILDENGVIVAKNLRGAALEEKIAEMLQ